LVLVAVVGMLGVVNLTLPGASGPVVASAGPNDSSSSLSVDLERASSSHVQTVVPETSGTASGCVLADLTNPYPELTEGSLAFNGNLFALPSGAIGETNLCYNAQRGELSDTTTFTSLPGAPQHGVLGYPEAILGENIYGGLAGKQGAMLPLPADTYGNLTRQNVWVGVDYDVHAKGGSPYDFAFDDWFSVDRATSTSTGNVGDRIELMIWLSNDIGMYLPQTKVSIPSYLNGNPAPGTWYRDDLCMGSQDITFDYLYAPNGNTPGYGEHRADIALDLTSILKNIASVLNGGACWASKGTSVSGFYADNFPIGAEFYPTTSDVASVHWRISHLCYTFTKGTVTGSEVDCKSSSSSGNSPTTAPAAAATPATPVAAGARTSGFVPLLPRLLPMRLEPVTVAPRVAPPLPGR
jgi:hypothetical protein